MAAGVAGADLEADETVEELTGEPARAELAARQERLAAEHTGKPEGPREGEPEPVPSPVMVAAPPSEEVAMTPQQKPPTAVDKAAKAGAASLAGRITKNGIFGDTGGPGITRMSPDQLGAIAESAGAVPRARAEGAMEMEQAYAHQQALAAIQAKRVAEIQQKREQELRQMRARADKLNEDAASMKIDPTRIWSGLPNWARVVAIVSTAMARGLQDYHASRGTIQKQRLYVDEAIDRDIKLQKMEIEQAWKRGQEANNALRTQLAIWKDMDVAESATRELQMKSVEGLINQAKARGMAKENLAMAEALKSDVAKWGAEFNQKTDIAAARVDAQRYSTTLNAELNLTKLANERELREGQVEAGIDERRLAAATDPRSTIVTTTNGERVVVKFGGDAKSKIALVDSYPSLDDTLRELQAHLKSGDEYRMPGAINWNSPAWKDRLRRLQDDARIKLKEYYRMAQATEQELNINASVLGLKTDGDKEMTFIEWLAGKFDATSIADRRAAQEAVDEVKKRVDAAYSRTLKTGVYTGEAPPSLNVAGPKSDGAPVSSPPKGREVLPHGR